MNTTHRTISFITLILLTASLLSAQNHLPEERKGDWQHAGSLRFIRDSVIITKTNNILEYGGNNSGETGTNNHIAIANAMADRSEKGYTCVYFPAGTYLIESAVGFHELQNVILCGEGSDKTRFIFSFTTGDATCFYLAPTSKNIGLENFYIERTDITESGRYFSMHADSCWLSGIESYNAATDHVYINSHHIEIRGCYFHHCRLYDTGGQGYGIVLHNGASGCLIENNIFNHFRHSVILSDGPHDNVIGYNYSRDPYTTEEYLGINDWPSDMCLHGHPDAESTGPYKNLFEGNICSYMHADDAWGENGPYNTYFRSRATGYGLEIKAQSPAHNIIANEVDDADGNISNTPLFESVWSAFNIQSADNYVIGNINFDASPVSYPDAEAYSADYSLYFDPESLPDFLATIAYFPPIGAVDADNLGGGSIPAKDRWDAGGVLTIPETHPHAGQVLISDLTLPENAAETTHDTLHTTFGDDFPEGDLTFAITDNSNPDLVTVEIDNGILMVTPATGANGTATIVVTAENAEDGTSATDEFVITILSVNSPPSFLKGEDQSVPEDAGVVTVEDWATNISAGPADEAEQELSFSLTTDSETLFSQLPAVDKNGTLTFTPAPDASGTVTVTLVLSDNGGTVRGGIETSPSQSFIITVTPVNDLPSFTKGADIHIPEDTGAVTIENWASDIAAGPADESAQQLTFALSTDNESLFSKHPAIDGGGTLTFTPAPNASGTATVTVTLSDGTDTSEPQPFDISIRAVNDLPSFTKGNDLSVPEDTGAISMENWATDISAGGADEADQELTFTVTIDKDTLFSALPAIDADGTLTFTPAPDVSGSATVSVSVSDGTDSSEPQEFSITITPVNDLPSFTKGTDQSVPEDTGAVTIENWASDIAGGPTDEAEQVVTFTVTTDTNDLFADVPTIDASGTLSFTPADNSHGTASVSVTLSDDKEAESEVQTFSLTITPVNDAPEITSTAVTDAVVHKDYSYTVTAVDIDGDDLTFTLDDKPEEMTIDAETGKISWSPKSADAGTCEVAVTVKDGNGASDTQEFTITVDVSVGVNYATTSSATNDEPIHDLQLHVAPNPARHTENQIHFILTGAGRVQAELTILDAAANVVFKKQCRVTLHGTMTPLCVWNMKTRAGRNVASGTYLAVVTIRNTTDRTATRLEKLVGVR